MQVFSVLRYIQKTEILKDTISCYRKNNLCDRLIEPIDNQKDTH